MKIIFFTYVLIFATKFGYSQTVANNNVGLSLTLPEIALLDIEPNNSVVSISLPTPSEAGLLNKKAENPNAKWLNYTSAVKSGKYRNVTVQIEYGNVPAGTRLSMMASSGVGGRGVLGFSNGQITLSSTPQKIINLIGGAYTGNGANAGHPLSYFLEVTEVSDLNFDASGTLGLVFTLIDN